AARKGAAADDTLRALHAKVEQLDGGLLPPGVRIVSFLDRSNLVEHTTHTVLRNLAEGMLLVTVVLLVFLGNTRGALIVAATIPFSLLFASILLDLRRIPANLLSLGALDFGMLVDGSVVMVENLLRHVTTRRDEGRSLTQTIAEAAHEVQRPVFFAVIIIITAYLPIFTLQPVAGRLFAPIAWTVAFALLGALLFALVLAPVLARYLLREDTREWHNPVLVALAVRYRRGLAWCLRHRGLTIGAAGGVLGLTLLFVMSGVVGSEFLPPLDEGASWVRGTLPASTGPSATGFFNTEYFVDLKPRAQWRSRFATKEDLIAATDTELEKIPGVIWNFS